MKRKWKTTLFISIVLVVLGTLFGVFYAVIINTPNLNVDITFKANGVLGVIDSKIDNANNGAPSSYFSFDYTTEGDDIENWKCNNLLFKGDTSTITLSLVVKNMSHFNVSAKTIFDSPHKNAKVTTMLNGVETDISNFIVNAKSEILVKLIIGKINIKDPIRANLKLTLSLSPVEESL